MLRTYVQILRSGVAGRKSLGIAPKRLVREWLAARDEDALFRSSVGTNLSPADVVKMVHPKPATGRRAAFYAYLLGRTFQSEALPPLVMQYERFKAGTEFEPPDLPFTMLSALPLSRQDWGHRRDHACARVSLPTDVGIPELRNHGSARSPGRVAGRHGSGHRERAGGRS